ncbi:hypothetical protein VTN77DRAFT_5255 [Rasamsonia byssochlamydoides]|uniref:uncharacterized protein n=1 Tax=Rasamsonia byssochlamydoides TaxID=89139 RepID=UPI003742DF73
MAANDYYNSFRQESSPDQYSSFHDGYHHPVPTKPLPPSAYDPHNDLYHDGHSQDNPYDTVGGANHGADQYAEDIPLKPNAQQPPQVPEPNWMQQNTHYSPEVPLSPEADGRGRRRQRRGFFGRKIAWVTYLLTLIDVAVFIGELVKNAQLTGSPFEIHPTFNPMIGPSPYVQINMGARFVPCMKNVPGIQDSTEVIYWNCPNSTSSDTNDPSNRCTLSELCGFGGVPNPHPGGSLNDRPEPDQWYRFIIPMFLHGGIIHIGFNMLMQMTMGADMERNIGWWRYALVYFSSGIFGFVLGGNYAAQGITSTGASGSLFGIMALFLLDLLYTWRERRSPWSEFIFMIIEVGISFALGLLPGLDNFSHIGGFIMGLAMGLCMMRSPNYIRERIGLARTPYVVMSGGAGPGRAEEEDKDRSIISGQPLRFFQGRKPLWWAWWLVRAGALVAVVIGFIVLVTNFYKYPGSTCSWCYRLSCLPIKNWCSLGNLQLTPSS